jgi:hypothetical protein
VTAPICLPAEVRPIPGFPGYAVSAAGDVYGPRRLRRASIGTKGYAYVSVRRPGKVRPGKLWVHLAVLAAWVGPKPEGQEARHLNGRQLDNRVENLEWATHVVNIADKVDHGTLAAKLTAADVQTMRASWPGSTFVALGRRYGVDESTARRAVRGQYWSHVS